MNNLIKKLVTWYINTTLVQLMYKEYKLQSKIAHLEGVNRLIQEYDN